MSTPADIQANSVQQQFLDVISRDEAVERFQKQLVLVPLGRESVLLQVARGRVLASDVISPIDVPGFDRSNVDGFAIQSADTNGASEEAPVRLALNHETLVPGTAPICHVVIGTASPISTGGMLPRGADAVLMVEDSHYVVDQDVAQIEVTRAVAVGNMISFAGTDVSKGETILWEGQRLTSREIGVLASLGMTHVEVYRKPRVAIISTGDEVVSPGNVLPLGCVYDSNAAILSAAVEECGGEPDVLGRAKDNLAELQALLDEALKRDVILLSGGTSKGAGDLSYRLIEQFTDPGIVAHGVALKPGKPICLAVTHGKPLVILPGFPTSAIFTFHEFVAPVIRALAGISEQERSTVSATLPMKINSGRGRTEYLLVRLFSSQTGLAAYPIGKGSGSVTTFSQADGFITIPQHTEILDADTIVEVTLLDKNVQPADFVVIGSHCIGLDVLLGKLRKQGVSVAVMHVGSQAGLAAVRRGECDIAGIHLLDAVTNSYNTPFLSDDLTLISGYQRMQSFVYRRNDSRFKGLTWERALQVATSDLHCSMVNRNLGSGTRILTDQLFEQLQLTTLPPGYSLQVKSHNAVAAAISQQRADWGIAIECVADQYDLATIPIREEHYDFVVKTNRLARPVIVHFQDLLRDTEIGKRLQALGFKASCIQ